MAMTSAVIHLYAVNLDRFRAGFEALSAEEEARVARKVDAVVRRRQRAAFAFVRTVLAKHLGQPANAIPIRRTPLGKPETDGLHFNLSHGAAEALLAVAPFPVGIDVEARIAPKRLRLARRVLAGAELAAWLAIPDVDAKARALSRAWVRKEAVLKALGTGLRTPANRVEVGWAGQGGRVAAPADQHFEVHDLPVVEPWFASLAFDAEHASGTLGSLQRLA